MPFPASEILNFKKVDRNLLPEKFEKNEINLKEINFSLYAWKRGLKLEESY